MVTVLCCCAVVLAACGKNTSSRAPASGGQVVAQVGNQVVTTNELENEFRLASVPPEKQKDPAVIKAAVTGLVTRKYLVQQALAAKLDQEPGVLLDLIRAREQVLENAYLMRAAAAKAPGSADIEKYIANNPSRFANRKLFTVDQIAFPLTSNSQSVVEANKDAETLENIDQQLTASGVAHSRQAGVLDSAEISPDFYNSIEARKPDQVFFVRSGSNGVFFKVTGDQAKPLSGDAAVNAARQLMRADAVKAQASLAAYTANIEAKYEGQYADIMKKNTAKD
jgi:EpsD family peptidyl-prolyl cis-trans isomerase